LSVGGGIIERMDETRGWLPEDLVLIPPGPKLDAILAGVDRGRLSDEDLVGLAQARNRQVAHLQAQLLADLHAIGQRSDEAVGRPEGPGAGRWAEVEVALAMCWTSRAAGGQLGLADDVIDKLPVVFAALDEGIIDVPKARVLCDAVVGLDTTTARRVVDQVIGEAHRLTTGQLRYRLRRLVLAADPDAVKRAAERMLPGRRVQAKLTDDGLAELAGYDLPPHRVAAAMERLTAIAKAAKSGGDTRRLDQLRADILLDLLVGDGVADGAPITTSTIGVADPAGEPTNPPQPQPSTCPAPPASHAAAANPPSTEDTPRDEDLPGAEDTPRTEDMPHDGDMPRDGDLPRVEDVPGDEAQPQPKPQPQPQPQPQPESQPESQPDPVVADYLVDPDEAESVDWANLVEEPQPVEDDGADDLDETEWIDLPDLLEEPEPAKEVHPLDPDATGPLDWPDPTEEPPPIEGDDAVDPDAEELAGMWSAGFNQLPTTRPQPHNDGDREDRPRAAMPAPRRGVIDIQVPLTTLLGLTDLPGDLAGWGPVIADIARQVVAEQPDATWRVSVYDQLGELISHGITRRRPTAPDAAFIKARDRTCRAPGCRMPAKHCDIDHTHDWASSKDSRRCNLACLCKKHHMFKHLTGSDLIQITPGVLGWTTPLGQRYVTRPEPYPDDDLLLMTSTHGPPD
jgi:hypothetical protein